MSLHPINLPNSARNLRGIVGLQRILLKALCEAHLDPDDIDVTWLQNVWVMLDAEWVRKFCLGGTKSVLIPLKKMVGAPTAVRQLIYSEFRRQNRTHLLFDAGGDFRRLVELQGVDVDLASHVHKFFVRCYELLGHNKNKDWFGYQLTRNRTIVKQVYKEDFYEHNRHTLTVCPYCDGPNDRPDLDHYFPKDDYPLLACSPWNLIPICSGCNDLNAKGTGAPLTVGSPNSTDEWLHPFFRPASAIVRFELDGGPRNSKPTLWSSTRLEVVRLNNHTALIRGVQLRWERRVSDYFDRLVFKVRRRLAFGRSINEVVGEFLEDYEAVRGREDFSMIYSAVCRAVLDGRPEYLSEFIDSNPPLLS